MRGHTYDYAGECHDCPHEYRVFTTKDERDAWRLEHQGHNIDCYLQARV